MKKLIYFFAPLFFLSACELMTSYEIDTTPNVLINYKMVDYMKAGKDSILTPYYEAIVHAGLVDKLLDDSAETVIVPSKLAFDGMLKAAGYNSITEINKGVLRALLEYMILPGRYISYEMTDGETLQLNSKSGDRIYFGRKSSSTDSYVLYVNQVPSTDKELSAIALNVSRQDMAFKDKVVQVVDGFPRYQLKIPATDNAPAMGVRLNIDGDTHTWASAAGANVYWSAAVQGGYRTDGSQNRTGMFLFEQKSVSQLSEISSAVLNLYLISNATKDPQVSTIKLYNISNEIDWNSYTIKTITKAFKPSITDTTTLIGEFAGFSTPGMWYQIDLTGFIKNYYNTPDRKPLFIGLRPSVKATTGNMTFGWKHEDDASRSVNPAYIDITGPMTSELTVQNNLPLTCPKGKYVVITPEVLSMAGPDPSPLNLTYTDNNIIYVVSALPQDGAITRGGLPLGVDGRFTQADIVFRNVKYFSNGNASSDSFVLQGRDYAGATVPGLITVQVNLQ